MGGHEESERRRQGEFHPGEGDEGREGHEGHEEGEHRCQGELHPGEGDEGREGYEGHEEGEHRCQGDLHPGEGDEGREGDEGHEEGEHRCQGDLHPGKGDEGSEGHEGHEEVSWGMSTSARPLRVPGGCASSVVWVSPHSRRAWARMLRAIEHGLLQVETVYTLYANL